MVEGQGVLDSSPVWYAEAMSLMQRIATDPAICHGKPCIRGHRIPISIVLDSLADGESVEEILAEFPGIERDDIAACLAYAAELARGRLVEVQPGATA
jgi:uncharacterized protein (DUF433 family)